MKDAREQFGSRLGFILAAAGSAVGIGNLVGFPVAATKGGGGAFLVCYAIFVVFICIPIMMAELALGRRTQSDPIGAFRREAGEESPWRWVGLLFFVTPFMIAVFYMVITVWILGYFVEILLGNLTLLAEPGTFQQFINNNSVFIYLVVVAVIVNVILLKGVKEGIERTAKLLMPALFVLLLCLVGFVLTLENASLGVNYYLIPDLTKIDATTLNIALSQAFFSLSLGMGILITYGSYMSREESVQNNSKFVAGADTAVAFFAGLLILPAIFAINPDTNPSQLSDSSIGLTFTYLPGVFLELESVVGYIGASAVAAVFFLLVFMAALTSLVSITEVPAASLIDGLGLSRKKALVRISTCMLILTMACVTSFGMSEWLTDFAVYADSRKSLFDVIVDLFYDTILPLNGLLLCLFVRTRWKRTMDDELKLGDTSYIGSYTKRYVDFSLSTFIPIVLFVIFSNTVADKYFGISFFQ